MSECGELLEHLSGLREVPVGILLLCLIGMRDIEAWYVSDRGARRTIKVESLSSAQALANGAALVQALLDFEDGETKVTDWTQLCAAALWSELLGAEVECLWTGDALRSILADAGPEARFFPWASPAWRHGAADTGPSAPDPRELPVRGGLNPVLVRGLFPGARPSAVLRLEHFTRARRLLRQGPGLSQRTRPSGRGRLDRYFGSEAIESSLGVLLETSRFRAALFEWMRQAGLDQDDPILTAEALLMLREPDECGPVSCNSFAFRWRTRAPFSYQRLTLGQLHRLLRSIHRLAEPLVPPQGASGTADHSLAHGSAVSLETRCFSVRLQDGRLAAGEVSRVPARALGAQFVPDLAVAQAPARLAALVRQYERETGHTVVLAVNGGYFLDRRSTPRDHPEWLGKPVGLLKRDGRIVSGPFFTGRPVLCFDPGQGFALRFVCHGLCAADEAPLSRAYEWVDDTGEYSRWRTAIEAGPLLVAEGRTALELESAQWASRSARLLQAAPVEMADLRTARTAVCVSKAGDLHLVTVYGRVRESVGLTHEELAAWIEREIPEVDWAIEMDAGGSVAAWHLEWGTTTLASRIGAPERPIGSAIVLALVGSGQEL